MRPGLTLIALTMALSLSGCGNGDAAEQVRQPVDTPGAEQSPDNAPVPDETDAPDGIAEIYITGDDAMSFDTDEFTVHPGQTVRLTLEHIGQMGIEQMGHNVVILSADEDPADFGQAVVREGGDLENQYVPEALRDRVMAFTRMVGGGESDTVEFTAPDEPGEYPFVCSFPGHYAVMNGVMIVRE